MPPERLCDFVIASHVAAGAIVMYLAERRKAFVWSGKSMLTGTPGMFWDCVQSGATEPIPGGWSGKSMLTKTLGMFWECVQSCATEPIPVGFFVECVL